MIPFLDLQAKTEKGLHELRGFNYRRGVCSALASVL